MAFCMSRSIYAYTHTHTFIHQFIVFLYTQVFRMTKSIKARKKAPLWCIQITDRGVHLNYLWGSAFSPPERMRIFHRGFPWMVCTTHTPIGCAAAGCFQGRASQVFAVLPTHLNFVNCFATVRSSLFPPHCHEPCKPSSTVILLWVEEGEGIFASPRASRQAK